jgi:hypothetical protein
MELLTMIWLSAGGKFTNKTEL